MLCIYTVIPSLFPFLFLSALLNSSITGRKISSLRPLGRLCGIPNGGESILLIGLLGGYPAGAKCINDTYRNGQLTKADAQRMLGFCNNAGPAFLFGMLSRCFSSSLVTFALWMVHVFSVVLTGVLLPGKQQRQSCSEINRPITVSKALDNSLKAMASICGWIVLFRVVIKFCERWFLWLFPGEWQVLIIGILELSNGCITLSTVKSEALRFVLAACMLSLGGLCVAMQTVSVTKELGIGMYFPGKLLQTALSLLLASAVSPFLFSPNMYYSPVFCAMIGVCTVGILIFLYRRKKVVAFV